MYARLVSGPMKFGNFNLATKTLESEVIPLLRKQRGFKDELSFFDKDKEEAVAISFWETKQDADRYVKDFYPTVRESMADVFKGEPEVRDFDIGNSTWYGIHAS